MKLDALARIALALSLGSAVCSADVVISEFLAVNDSVLQDEDGDFEDWIELHNDGGSPVDLTNYYLTDDDLDLIKWQLPAVSLPAGGYMLVFASLKDRSVAGSELHTNFKLDGGGEYLALVEPDGSTIVAEFAPEYPDQLEDIAYGILGSESGYFDPPTPAAANGTLLKRASDVAFSHPRGYYDSSFNLSLTCAEANCTIRYTLDGTAPTATTGLVYSSPIQIATTETVRAAGFIDGFPTISTVVTSTYIFGADVLGQSDAGAIAAGFPADWVQDDGSNWTVFGGGNHPGAWYGLDQAILADYTTQELVDSLQAIPTISLVMPVDDWFGYNPPSGPFGVYVNSEKSGDDWDRAGSAEFIDPAGGPEFQINCGLGVQGGSSTFEDYRSQLSIDMKFQSQFGPTKLEFDLFEDSTVDRFDYLTLDAGNQNSLHQGAGSNTKIHAQGLRDQFMMNLHHAMGGESPHGRHVHVFINGLYWGIYDLHEKPDHRWAEEHLGGDETEYDFIKEGGVFEGNSNSASHPSAPGAWATVLDITNNGIGDADTYGGQSAYEAFQEYVDLNDYIDYMLLNFYGGNTDWPQRNWMATSRSRIGPNLTDINPDLAFLFHSWDAEDVLHWGGAVTDVGGFYDRTQVTGSSLNNVAWFYTELQNHSEFALRFADRAHAHLFNGGALYVDPAFDDVGTPFDPAFPERNRPASVYHPLGESVEGAMPMAYARWANYWDDPGDFTPDDWETERTRLLEDYFPIRSGVLLAQLVNKGLYPTLDAPSFNQHGGEVPLGFNLAVTGPGGADIYFTTDGSDPRLVGGAVNPGASAYTAPVAITELTTVKARAFDSGSGTWSALNEATFAVSLNLRVNEFMADNQFTIFDEFGQFEDWIELYNRSSSPIDLTGLYLSDDLLNPTKWQFPNGTVIGAGEYMLIWADEDPGDGPLHASFRLSKSGESIGLFHTDATGNLLIDSLNYGAQTTDVSQGILPDGTGPSMKLLDPSPGAPNVPLGGDSVRYDALDLSINAVNLSLLGTPNLGQPVTLSVTNAPPNDIGVLLFGLTPISVPGLLQGTLLVLPILPELWQIVPLDGFGTGAAPLLLPNDASLAGATLYWQEGNVTNEGLSNGLSFTLGP